MRTKYQKAWVSYIQPNFLLNQKSTKNVYFFFIHIDISTYRTTYKTKLKKILTYKKKQLEQYFLLTASLMPNHCFLTWMHSIFTNIYQNLILLYKAHTGTAPSIFFNKFSKINHNYPTSSKSSSNYTIPKLTMKLTYFAISRRVPILWDTVLDTTKKK